MTAAEAEMGGKREREKRERDVERGRTEKNGMEVFVSYKEVC